MKTMVFKTNNQPTSIKTTQIEIRVTMSGPQKFVTIIPGVPQTMQDVRRAQQTPIPAAVVRLREVAVRVHVVVAEAVTSRVKTLLWRLLDY
jgi:hypothetical protein